MSKQDFKSIAMQVFKDEADGIEHVAKLLDEHFNQAVDTVLKATGRVVITGMGKSGLIGQKIAATLASTGTPSFFVHPAEGFHGDLGMLHPSDVVLAISFSGETDEVIKILPFLSDNGNQVIAMTGNSDSTLARYANCHLCVSIPREACPLDLAPTTSTTVTLVMGDALAVALMKARDFKPESFARFHPGGNLGYRLLTTVNTVMRKDNLPKVALDDSMLNVIQSLSSGRLGAALVMDGASLQGIVTDGDLRRSTEKHAEQFIHLSAKEIMTTDPLMIPSDMTLEQAKDLMTEKNVTCLVVGSENCVEGVVQLFDCYL